MTRRTRSGRLRRLWPLGLVIVGVGLTGWAAAWGWFLPRHLAQKTGRPDVPRVSCLHCHGKVEPPPVRGLPDPAHYLSPEDLVVSPDGARLFVTAPGADSLIEIDLAQRQIARTVRLPGRPHGVAISADGGSLAVTSRDGDVVHVLDAATLRILNAIPAEEPLGVAISEHGDRVYVANGLSDDLLIEDRGGSEAIRLVMGNEPYAVALAPDGRLLAVVNRKVDPRPPRELAASELTLVDARGGRVVDRRSLTSAHLSEGVVLSSDGGFALATILRFRNLLPLTQVARGAVMNSALAFIETRAGGRTVQFPLDEVNAYFADPAEVVLTPDDRIAFVAHAGAGIVTAVDVPALRAVLARSDARELEALADDMGASGHYVLARIPTRHGPRGLAVSPDGERLFVAERLADTIAVIDTRRLELVERIDLGGSPKLTAERRGERIFHDASGTFQGQFSCRSCHPDGHTDGLIWDFEIDGVGLNLLETRSLLGIRDTAPFKWNGKNPDLRTQCGPRFARVLTRSDPFTPSQLDDLVAYIESLALPPPRLPAGLSAARERGERLFFRTETNRGEVIPVAARCNTCHRPPLFTDRFLTDVGTGGRFDTPHLFDVASTPPYLHDGRALTLEEIWTVHSPEDTHGVTSDLTKLELNDLIIYLRSL